MERMTRAWHVVTAALAFWSAFLAPATAQPVSFVARRDFLAGTNPMSVTKRDFNGDGVPDLAVNNSSGTVSVLLGNGNGTFQAPRSSDAGGGGASLAAGDFNGDRVPDLVVNNFNSSSVSILLGNGDGTFRPPAAFAAGPFPDFVVAGDFNGDGAQDLAVASSQSTVLLLGNGDGTFQAARSFAGGSSAMAVGDLNRDGKLDLTTASLDNSVSVLLGNGDGTFRPPMKFLLSSSSFVNGPLSVAVGDFNRDGIPDLAAAPGGRFDGVAVLLGNGDGTLRAAQTFGVGSSAGAVAVGDFNADGVQDLAVTNHANASLAVLLGAGDGTFGAATTFPVGSSPFSLAVGDFNGDTRLDLTVANEGSNSVSLLLGTGDGSFQTAPIVDAGSQPLAIAAGDVTGDGAVDVAVANQDSDVVSVLIGNGDGTFHTGLSYLVFAIPRSLALGDFNGDGKPDLAVVDSGSGAVTILRNNGEDTFAGISTFTAGSDSRSVTVGDFNRDGKLDLAVANHGSNDVSVLLGNGDLSFQAPLAFGAGSGPVGVAAGDVNGDGAVDLAVGNDGSRDVSVLLGNGDGTFQAALTIGSEFGDPRSVAMADFNGDGRADIAVAHNLLYSVSVLLSNGDGTFQAARGFGAVGNPVSVVASDFNGDGKPDLAVAGGPNSVAVLINNTLDRTPAPDAVVATLLPEDTFLNLDRTSYGAETTLATYTWPDHQVANAILMKFDLAALPAGAVVEEATLRLALVRSDASADGAYTVTANKVLGKNPVIAKATGYTIDGLTAWSPNACCFGGVPLAQADISPAYDSQAIDKVPGYKVWTVTRMVQEWRADPATNFGLLLNSDASKLRDRYRVFASMEEPDLRIRPFLRIAYTLPATADTTPPSVTINQAATQADPTSASPINFTAVFSEPVSGFTSADVTVGGTAGGMKTVTVTGGPSTYTVAVSGMTTSGTVIASIPAGVTTDAAGNPNTASTSTDSTVTFNALDTTPPTVAISQAATQADPTSASPINFTAVFSVPVSGFTSADVTVGGTAGGIKTVTVSGGPSTYTVAVSGMTTDGTVTASIPAGVTTDAAGNANTASTSTDNTVTFIAPAPTTATRFEDTDLSITYEPGCDPAPNPCPLDWFHGSRSRAWSAATSSFNRATGARATFRFTGTSVTWIGFRAWWAGIAKVSVDGVFQGEVDLYVGAGLNPAAPPCDPDGTTGPQQPSPGCVDEDVRAPVFTARGLTAGVEHTLAIEVTGQRNSLVPADCGPANCNAVVVDAFDVGPSVSPPVEGQRSEETSPAVGYTGGWTQGDMTRAWSGGTAAVSTTVGAQATFTFTGTSVRWIGLRGPQTGIARIFLDGAFQAEVDTYATTEFQAGVFSATDLAPAGHTLKIEVAGKNPAATSNLIVVDAFDVGSRFEEKDRSVVYSGAWMTGNDSRNWSGTTANAGTGTAALSGTAGAAAEFTFTGTSVSWIGFRAPRAGLADVSVDGAFITRVDLYSPTEQLRVPVFTMDLPAPGPHTLRIVVTGERNPASEQAVVTVDAFDVRVPSPGVPVRRFQETDLSLSPTYVPMAVSPDQPDTGWVNGNGFPFWSGETAMFSTMAGARATLTFTGTSVTWIGDRSLETGIAQVSLDGGLPVDVDTFANVLGTSQAPIFSQRGLTPGTHTLTIKVTGLKNAAAPASSMATIVIDAIDVQAESASP